MDTGSTFGFEASCAAIVGGMTKALSERNGETPEQQFVRLQVATHTILAFLPRDAIEAMLASHCVMFHELMVDGVPQALQAPDGKPRRAALQDLLAENKAFLGNLGQLRSFQRRPAEGSREAFRKVSASAAPKQAPAVEQPVPAEAPPASPPAAPHVTAKPQSPPPDRSKPATTDHRAANYRPGAAEIAACRANPAAAAALMAGDAAGFARAMGIAEPGEAFLAAARAEGSPFNPKSSGPWPDSAWLDKTKT